MEDQHSDAFGGKGLAGEAHRPAWDVGEAGRSECFAQIHAEGEVWHYQQDGAVFGSWVHDLFTSGRPLRANDLRAGANSSSARIRSAAPSCMASRGIPKTMELDSSWTKVRPP